ncbi:unnamed protein product, partial [Meganyctiphanes norvegica]
VQGLMYQLWVYDDKNQMLSAGELEKLLQDIIDDANKHKESISETERSIAALTGLPRTDWWKIQSQHFIEGINRDNMDIINKAVCMIVLFDIAPENISEKGKNLLHADGRTIW